MRYFASSRLEQMKEEGGGANGGWQGQGLGGSGGGVPELEGHVSMYLDLFCWYMCDR